VLIFGGRYARDSGKDVAPVFAMALKDLDAALEFDPTCSPAYHNRGIVRFYMARSIKKGAGDPEPDYRKAIDDFSRAAELEPTVRVHLQGPGRREGGAGEAAAGARREGEGALRAGRRPPRRGDPAEQARSTAPTTSAARPTSR
jgi:tetratricopeptide (TPR) repeat protein